MQNLSFVYATNCCGWFSLASAKQDASAQRSNRLSAFWYIFSVHPAEGTYAPSSHVLPCACFGRTRPKCVMRRGLRATFRPAENKDTGGGKKRDKRQEGMPAGDRKVLETSLNVERNRTFVSRETFSIIFFAKCPHFFSKRISLFAY